MSEVFSVFGPSPSVPQTAEQMVAALSVSIAQEIGKRLAAAEFVKRRRGPRRPAGIRLTEKQLAQLLAMAAVAARNP